VAVDLSGKKLQILQEITASSRLGFLANGNDSNVASRSAAALKAAAALLGIELHVFEVREPEEIRPAFDEFARLRVGGVITQPDGLFFNERTRIGKLAIERRIETLGHVEELADDGFLMTFGPSAVLMIRRAATYVDNFLSGTPPAELPVELATKIDLAINSRGCFVARKGRSIIGTKSRKLSLHCAPVRFAGANCRRYVKSQTHVVAILSTTTRLRSR
jgi:putative tryptophan/tyrosine transport system substrate-binding protein